MKTIEELLSTYNEIEGFQTYLLEAKDNLLKKCNIGIIDIFERLDTKEYDLIGNNINVSVNLDGDELIESIKLDSNRELHFYIGNCDYSSEDLGGEILYWIYTLLYEELFL